MEALRQSLEALPKGSIVLDAPKAMKVGAKRKVDAEIGFDVPEILRRQPHSGSQTVEGTLHISPEMVATLIGPGFEIKTLTPEQQLIAQGLPTVWSWSVEATESGEQELEATLYALVPIGDRAVRIRVASYTHKISVSVREQTWGEWLESFGHKVGTVQAIVVAFGAIVTPVLTWLGISLHRRRNAARRAGAPPVEPEIGA